MVRGTVRYGSLWQKQNALETESKRCIITECLWKKYDMTYDCYYNILTLGRYDSEVV